MYGEDDQPPAGAMRAYARGQIPGGVSPAGSQIPPALQGFQPSRTVQPVIQPLPELAAPKFDQQGPGAFDFLKQGVDTIQKFQKSAEQEKFSEWQKDMQRQIAELKAMRARAEKIDPSIRGSAQGQPEPGSLEDYFARNRQFESGNDPNATNPGSGASGLYQFLPSTWRALMQEAPQLGLTPEGIKDEKQQDAAMRYYTNKSVGLLTDMLGRKPTGGELYSMHLLGHSGGANVLKNLDAPITATINPAAIRGNPFLNKFKTGRDLIAGLNQQFGG